MKFMSSESRSLTLALPCREVALPKGRAPRPCSQSTVLCLLTAGVHRIPDALQLYRVSEDGALAFHPGMDRHFLHFHPGNRKDERGNHFHQKKKKELREKTVGGYIWARRGEGDAPDPSKPRTLKKMFSNVATEMWTWLRGLPTTLGRPPSVFPGWSLHEP